MRKPKNKSVRSITQNILLVVMCYVVLTVLLSSCSPELSVLEESKQTENKSPNTHYSIMFFIHGDSDYLYRDTSNNEYNADEVTVMKAKRVAEQNPNGEVFIFHQKPKSNFLFFFPQRDGEFYYYRNGQLIANDLYWRDQEKSDFNLEAALYRQYHVVNQDKLINMFLYFGHEIPEVGGVGYDESYPDRSFTIDDLAGGMKSFTSDSIKFDLTILSTCYGGTPYTIGKLLPITKTIIASPENLHLSYFDISPLERLDVNLKDGDVPAFAKRFAGQSFDKLASSVETTVSVVVYDVNRVQNFVNSVQKDYDQILDNLKRLTQAELAVKEHCDCADIPAYRISTIKDGVDVLYRAARFGRSKNIKSHSGWECWKY